MFTQPSAVPLAQPPLPISQAHGIWARLESASGTLTKGTGEAGRGGRGVQVASAGQGWSPVEDSTGRVCGHSAEFLPRPFPSTIQNLHYALEKWITA